METDNRSPETVLSALRYCASLWVPEARIVGNIRAGDIIRSIDAVWSEIDSLHRKIESLSIEEKESYARKVEILSDDLEANGKSFECGYANGVLDSARAIREDFEK
jgi:hypothetical protein